MNPRGRFNFGDSCYVRNFGADYLRGSTLAEEGGDIVAIGAVQKSYVLVHLVKWDRETGKLVPLQGSSRSLMKIGGDHSRGHIRDIAWGPRNISFSRGTKTSVRVLAIVTDESLLVLEVELADSNTVSTCRLVYKVDVDKTISTNSDNTKLAQATKICSTCTGITWHPCAVPTLLLFRSNAPPIRVTLKASLVGGASLPRDDAEVLVLNFRDGQSDKAIAATAGAITGTSLIASANGLGIVKCDTPLIEKPRSARSRTSHTPAYSVSACTAEFMRESEGLLAVVYSSEFSQKERPLLELGGGSASSTSSVLAATIPQDGKFRHVLAGESILSALSVTSREDEGKDLEVLRAGVARRENMSKGVLWRDDVALSVPDAAVVDTSLGSKAGGGGVLSTLLSISQGAAKAMTGIEATATIKETSAKDAAAIPQEDSGSSRRLRVLNLGESEEGSEAPTVTDIPFPSSLPPDMGCVLPASNGASLLFACAGKRARVITISRVDLRSIGGQGGGAEVPCSEVTLPEGMTARGLHMRWGDVQDEDEAELLVLAVAKVEASGSLASFGAAAQVDMCLLSYNVGGLDRKMAPTVSVASDAKKESERGERDTDQVLLAAAVSHHVSRLSTVSERRRDNIEQGRRSELVCACCVEPGTDADGEVYCLNGNTLPPAAAPATIRQIEQDKQNEQNEQDKDARNHTGGIDGLQLREILQSFSSPIIEELQKQREAISSLDSRMRMVEQSVVTLYKGKEAASGGDSATRRMERATKAHARAIQSTR